VKEERAELVEVTTEWSTTWSLDYFIGLLRQQREPHVALDLKLNMIKGALQGGANG